MRNARMKTGVLVAVSIAASLLGAPALHAADSSSRQAAPRGLLGELWARLRLAAPQSGQVTASQAITAGIRGAEATESELKPYWKDDREQDPAFRAERQELQAAQELADKEKFAEAARAFDAFAAAHPKSPLVPNARFGGALAQASLGDKTRAIAAFEAFIKDNPQHPLARDAEQALAALK